MRAFLSYSINDKDQYVLTLLANKLRNDGFSVASGNNYLMGIPDLHTENQILQSHLFIGLITGLGKELQRVSKEWNYARKNNIPNLLLIEDSVKVHPDFKGKYIKFNRHNPQIAIDQINTKTKNAQNSSSNSEALAWGLGGAALLAIILLLADKK